MVYTLNRKIWFMGVKYLLRHYKEQHDLDVISETLIALTGLPLSTLIKWAKETDAQEED